MLQCNIIPTFGLYLMWERRLKISILHFMWFFICHIIKNWPNLSIILHWRIYLTKITFYVFWLAQCECLVFFQNKYIWLNVLSINFHYFHLNFFFTISSENQIKYFISFFFFFMYSDYNAWTGKFPFPQFVKQRLHFWLLGNLLLIRVLIVSLWREISCLLYPPSAIKVFILIDK